MELKKGQTIMVDVDLKLPAAILHEVVSNRSGMPLEGFALYYQSKQLEGEAALSTWGVEKDATIEVKTRGRGGTKALAGAADQAKIAKPKTVAAAKTPAAIIAAAAEATATDAELKAEEDATPSEGGATAAVNAEAAAEKRKAAEAAAEKRKAAEVKAAEKKAAQAAETKAAQKVKATETKAIAKEAEKVKNAEAAEEALETKNFEGKFAEGMQTRRSETADKMEVLQT